MGFTPYGFVEPRIEDTNPRRAGNRMRHLWGSMRSAPEPLGVGEGASPRESWQSQRKLLEALSPSLPPDSADGVANGIALQSH